MKEVIYNLDKLTDEDIDEIAVRVKAFIFKGEKIYLANIDNIYQLPGGHAHQDESLNEALKREIKEETGILLDDTEIPSPFFHITHCHENYRNSGYNRKNEIYYFVIKTDKEPDKNNTEYDKYEEKGNYTLSLVDLDEVEDIINGNELNRTKFIEIGQELLSALYYLREHNEYR